MYKQIFDKETFTETIINLREQYDFDIKKTKQLEKAFDVEFNTYNNSKITNMLFKLLQIQFPESESGCEIQFFCYELNFGRKLTSKKPISDLWDKLNRKTKFLKE